MTPITLKNFKHLVLFSTVFIALTGLSISTSIFANDVPALYKQYCAECHGEDRLGIMGPALLPQNLKRLRKKSAVEVIQNGRPATQMLPFADKLTVQEIESLVELIYTPLPEIPGLGSGQNKIQSDHSSSPRLASGHPNL